MSPQIAELQGSPSTMLDDQKRSSLFCGGGGTVLNGIERPLPEEVLANFFRRFR